MICTDCAKAADLNAKAASQGWPLGNFTAVHPGNCGCACQHKPTGVWKGERREDQEGNTQ